jgi:hypothetical protein
MQWPSGAETRRAFMVSLFSDKSPKYTKPIDKAHRVSALDGHISYKHPPFASITFL